MRRVTRTFTDTVEYDEFEPGEKVRPREFDRPLPPGVYTVTEFKHPMFAGDYPMLFVEGHRYGLNAHHFKLAEGEPDG